MVLLAFVWGVVVVMDALNLGAPGPHVGAADDSIHRMVVPVSAGGVVAVAMDVEENMWIPASCMDRGRGMLLAGVGIVAMVVAVKTVGVMVVKVATSLVVVVVREKMCQADQQELEGSSDVGCKEEDW